MFDPVEALKAYVRCQSVSTDSRYKGGMEAAQRFLKTLFESMAFEVEEVATPLHPLLLARRQGTRGAPHILCYGHYDVQPEGDPEEWSSPAFEPEIREGRLYGRGTADNKGPLMTLLGAVAGLIQSSPDRVPTFTFMIEGEEEIGSPSFRGFLKDYAQELSKADFVLVTDTSSPSVDQVAITTSLRGLASLEVTVRGPHSDLHSGLYGGSILNPVQALMEIGASLHDAEGRVNVPGFYDGMRAPAPWQKVEFEKLEFSQSAYRDELGVPALYHHPDYSPLECMRAMPTLEFNGAHGGYTGEGLKTIIPAKASAKISCRLVAGQDYVDILEKVKKTILQRAPKGVRVSVETFGGGNAYQVDPPHLSAKGDQAPEILKKAFKICAQSIESETGKAPLFLAEGGSIPIISDLKAHTGLDSILVGLFTPQDRIHASDESFDLDFMVSSMQALTLFFKSM